MRSASEMKWGSTWLGLLLLLPLCVTGSTVCGYMGPLAKEIENSFDKCYTDQVRDSRLRMAVGYEFCFGSNYQKLNNTVAGPYQKKTSDTQATILHLADSVCSDNEDALNEFILAGDGSFSPGEDSVDAKINPTDLNINMCKDFFDQINQALTLDNFQIASLMKANEKRLAGMFPDVKTREKVFLVVVNIVKPLAACHQPMVELRMRLIKKYLKRFLMDQITPSVPSFSGKTLPVVTHPEIFVSYQAVTQKKPPVPEFNWNQKRTRALTLAPKRVVKMQPLSESALTDRQRANIIAMDVRNANKPLEQRDSELMAAARSGRITDTQMLSMTPLQKLDANLISRAEYVRQVDNGEDHAHPNSSVEIDNLWDPSVSLKKKQFSSEDFDRYKIKGFDIDTKIKQLFGP